MSSNKMRIEIPKNPKMRLDLADEIFKKHTDLVDKSPLISIEKNNWTTEGPKIKLALQKHKEAEDFKTQMEEAYKERDLYLEDIVKAIKASRDVLAGVNHDNMKRIAEWGFAVYESVKSTSTKKSETK